MCTPHDATLERLCSRSSSRDLTPFEWLAEAALDQRGCSFSEVARFLNREGQRAAKLRPDRRDRDLKRQDSVAKGHIAIKVQENKVRQTNACI
jgi:hypothetical protein